MVLATQSMENPTESESVRNKKKSSLVDVDSLREIDCTNVGIVLKY
jgi:hypothetical protein